MKLLKFLFGFIAILLLLVIAGVAAFLATFDGNDYKDQLAKAVSEQTGRVLTINGDFKPTLFPRIGISLGQSELSNAEGFSDPLFAKVEEVQVSVAVLPLLKQQVEAERVVLRGLALNLERNAEGVFNWEDLIPKSEKEDPEHSEENNEEKGEPPRIKIGGISIEQASLSWRDVGQQVVVEPLNLETGAIELGKPIDLRLDLAAASTAPKANATLEVAGIITPNLETQQVGVEGLTIVLRGSGDLGAVSEAELALATDLQAALASQSINLSGLTLKVGARGQGLPGGELSANLSAEVEASPEAVKVRELLLESLGARLHGRAAVDDLASGAPRADIALGLSELNPRELLSRLQIPLPQMSPQALNAVSAELNLIADTNQLTINRLLLNLDESELQGSAKVSNFAQPAIRFDLALDRLDADRYLPPSAPKKPGEEPPPGEGSGEIELPVEQLRALDIDGAARIGQLRFKGLDVNNARVKVTAKEGLVQLGPLAVGVEQGSISNTAATLDVRESTPRFRVTADLDQIPSGPLLEAFAGDALVTGIADLSADLSSRGNTIQALRSGLNGELDIAFSNGAVKGINVLYEMRKLLHSAQQRIAQLQQLTAQFGMTETSEQLALLGGVTNLGEPEAEETDYSQIKASATITDGVLKNLDLNAASPFLRVGGEGTVDLGRERLDYAINTKLVGSPKGQGGEGLDALVGIAVPIKIGGTFSKPTILPDIKAEQLVRLLLGKDGANSDLGRFLSQIEGLEGGDLNAFFKTQQRRVEEEAKAALKREKARLEAKARAAAEREKERLEAKAREEARKLEDKLKNELEKAAGDLFKGFF